MQSSALIQPKVTVPLAVVFAIAISAILKSRSTEKERKEDSQYFENLSDIEKLPDEILLKIFDLLPSKEIVKTSVVSKRLRAISNDFILWKNTERETFFTVKNHLTQNVEGIAERQYLTAHLISAGETKRRRVFILGDVSFVDSHEPTGRFGSFFGFQCNARIGNHDYTVQLAPANLNTMDSLSILLICIEDKKDLTQYIKSIIEMEKKNVLCLLVLRTDQQKLPEILNSYSITIDSGNGIETILKKVSDKISSLSENTMAKFGKTCTII